MEVLTKVSIFLAAPLVWAVKLYQATLSPDHGWFKARYPHGYCRYYPTCSMYAVAVMEKQGLAGVPKAILRVLSCNPMSRGGIDLPYKGYKD